MSPHFQFFGFEPDTDLQINADNALDRLVDLAPYGSLPVALLEKTNDGFRCAIDLYTRHGPFVAHSEQSTASAALTHVVDAIRKKLERWKEMRLQNSRQEAEVPTVESVA